MLASADTFTAVALAAVAIAFLLGIGAFVGSLLGRRTLQNANADNSVRERQLPEKVIRELEQCLELGDCVARDVDSVTALLNNDSSAVPPHLLGALQQLIKTTKTLSGRLQRVEGGTSLSSAGSLKLAPRGTSPKATEREPPAKPATQPTATAKKDPDPCKSEPADSDESRRFPRSPCHGNLKATIYPPPSSPGGEPVHCTVLTRDLSCGGIGIAHAEQLYPRQIVVLDAIGKLLVGEVRWCRQLDERFYIAGCRLVKTSD